MDPITPVGGPEHRRQFAEGLKREYTENIWKNDLHLIRLNSELSPD